MKYISGFMIVILLAATFPAMTLAQAPFPGPPQAQTKTPVPLKIQIVISRYEGDKKVSSYPYTLAVTANERAGNLRMGSQVPVMAGPGPGAFNYQNVGTNIDCNATSIDDTRFKVDVSITDSSVMERRNADSAPTLRNFNATNSVVLRNGQTVQFIAAADKTTGEVVKVDVTLTVEK